MMWYNENCLLTYFASPFACETYAFCVCIYREWQVNLGEQEREKLSFYTTLSNVYVIFCIWYTLYGFISYWNLSVETLYFTHFEYDITKNEMNATIIQLSLSHIPVFNLNNVFFSVSLLFVGHRIFARQTHINTLPFDHAKHSLLLRFIFLCVFFSFFFCVVCRRTKAQFWI